MLAVVVLVLLDIWHLFLTGHVTKSEEICLECKNINKV